MTDIPAGEYTVRLANPPGTETGACYTDMNITVDAYVLPNMPIVTILGSCYGEEGKSELRVTSQDSQFGSYDVRVLDNTKTLKGSSGFSSQGQQVVFGGLGTKLHPTQTGTGKNYYTDLYTVEVNGSICRSDVSAKVVNLDSRPAIVNSIQSIKLPQCINNPDGELQFTQVSDDFSRYSYTLYKSDTRQSVKSSEDPDQDRSNKLTKVRGGDYYAQLIDLGNRNCSLTINSLSVAVPESLSLAVVSQTDIKCYGGTGALQLMSGNSKT